MTPNIAERSPDDPESGMNRRAGRRDVCIRSREYQSLMSVVFPPHQEWRAAIRTMDRLLMGF
jgi:hypothetical protein